MKKPLALLLCVLMLVTVTGCNQQGADTTTDAPAVTTTAPATTAPAPTETTAAPAPARENRLVYASEAQFDGDFASGLFAGAARDLLSGEAAASFSERTSNAVLTDLLVDYGTMALQRDGTYAFNKNILTQDPVRSENGDGTVTYTLQIRQDLYYNTGKAITARDYLFRTLFLNSATCATLDGRGYDGTDYPNGHSFYNCETDIFSDIRLLSDYSWSVTVTQQQAGYAFLSDFLNFTPWDVSYWLGEAYAIDGSEAGCWLTRSGTRIPMDPKLATQVSAHFTEARAGRLLPMTTPGAYALTSSEEGCKRIVLTRNPYYIGNFEGQIPSIETLELVYAAPSAWQTGLADGSIHLLDTVMDGSAINTLAELVELGSDLTLDTFARGGYGALRFACDITPTQFWEVRQAIAHLVDRNAIVSLYRQGWGTVVDGPYSDSLWMAQESRSAFQSQLNHYAYSVKTAEQMLEAGGWTLDEYGDPWTGDGLRYKAVTEAQAAYMDECIEVGDQILMPLIIKWAATDGNTVTDLLQVLLAQSQEVTALGMEIRVEQMDFASMLGHLYRQDIYGLGGVDYSQPEYSMFNLAGGWNDAQYDFSYSFTGDSGYVEAGYNSNHLFDLGDGGLDKLSMDMVYGITPGDRTAYLDLWQKYILRFNQLLPDLPLYADTYATAYPTWLENYDQDSFWGFAQAVLYASIQGCE